MLVGVGVFVGYSVAVAVLVDVLVAVATISVKTGVGVDVAVIVGVWTGGLSITASAGRKMRGVASGAAPERAAHAAVPSSAASARGASSCLLNPRPRSRATRRPPQFPSGDAIVARSRGGVK